MVRHPKFFRDMGSNVDLYPTSCVDISLAFQLSDFKRSTVGITHPNRLCSVKDMVKVKYLDTP